MRKDNDDRPGSVFRGFLESESAGGVILMAAAALALIVANSPLSETYFHTLHVYLGPLSVEHWINDGLMAVFFLLVGLEIKREMLAGQLATWPRRVIPGIGALGGMVFPALIFVWFNSGNPEALRGWAIPTATDIAFALGVLSLLGPRVPASLKVFLTALAIIDDLGAVVIIALFYTYEISTVYLAASAAIVIVLAVLNWRGVTSLVPYLVLGLVLWFFVLNSGVHATIAGVVLALTVPLRQGVGSGGESSPLHRLEHRLEKLVPFVVVPIFGFANAGISFAGMSSSALLEPLTLGVALGLVAGKLVGVFGTVALTVRAGLADLPADASWMQVLGVSLLCGIGFTMSLFVGTLAFEPYPAMLYGVKLGILVGSFVAGVLGALVLGLARPAAQAR